VYGEQALKDAWEATFTEKKMRQEAQEQLEALKRGILSSGGAEVLQQLLRVGEASMGPGGDELPMSPTMVSPPNMPFALAPGLMHVCCPHGMACLPIHEYCWMCRQMC